MFSNKNFSRHRLKNGLNVLFYETNSESSTISVMVRAGSMTEKNGIFGISHFIEHLMFEGTKNRTAKKISSDIENFGGEMNAATSEEYTNYYIKISREHLDKAIDVLGDMFSNSKFDEEAIEKERKIILSEIKMVYDEPRKYQWVQFERALFNGIKRGIPAYGSVSDVERISRRDILQYFSKYYTSGNILVCIVGRDLDKKILNMLEKSFIIKKGSKAKIPVKKFTPVSYSVSSRKMGQSYLIFGFPTPSRGKCKYAYDVARAIWGKPLSGRIYEELRIKRSIGYDAGVYYNPGIFYGLMSFYSSCTNNEIQNVEKIFRRELNRSKSFSPSEIKNAKSFIEGEFILSLDDPVNIADEILEYELSSRAEHAFDYLNGIRAVTKNDLSIISNAKTTFSVLKNIE